MSRKVIKILFMNIVAYVLKISLAFINLILIYLVTILHDTDPDLAGRWYPKGIERGRLSRCSGYIDTPIMALLFTMIFY